MKLSKASDTKTNSHQLTAAQLDLKKWSNSNSEQPAPCLVLLLSMTPYGLEYVFGQLGSSVPAISPLNLLCTPAHSLAGQWGKQKRALHCVNTVQQ